MELRTLYQSRCSCLLDCLCLVGFVPGFVRTHNVNGFLCRTAWCSQSYIQCLKELEACRIVKPKFSLAHQRTHRDVIIDFRISQETRGLGVPSVRCLRLFLFDGLASHLALRPLDQSPNLYSVGKHGDRLLCDREGIPRPLAEGRACKDAGEYHPDDGAMDASEVDEVGKKRNQPWDERTWHNQLH